LIEQQHLSHLGFKIRITAFQVILHFFRVQRLRC
jgi:hypothetical protein